MKRLILVQHCQAEHHINGMTGGWTDSALTAHGTAQALRTAAYVRALAAPASTLLSSDLQRAAQTAQPIGAALDIPVIFETGLREIHNGVAANRTREWAARHRLPKRTSGFDFAYREFENGETWAEFYARIAATMTRITRAADSDIIIVTHGCALSYILKWWLHFSTAEHMCTTHFQGRPGGVSVLEINHYDQHVLASFNVTTHLDSMTPAHF